MSAHQLGIGHCSYELKLMTFGARSVQLLCSESTTSEFVHASLLARMYTPLLWW